MVTVACSFSRNGVSGRSSPTNITVKTAGPSLIYLPLPVLRSTVEHKRLYRLQLSSLKFISMLTLYYKPTCPYCQSVLAEAEELGVTFRLKDIQSDIHMAEELLQYGGKGQVPFLIDPERGNMLYESEAIISYLREHYPKGQQDTFGGVRIHASDEICESCQ